MKTLLMLIVVVAAPSWADAPMPAPKMETVCSANGRYCAAMNAAQQITRIHEKTSTGQRELWSMPGWFRVAALANDGVHFVAGSDEQNLVPLHNPNDTVLLKFFERGKLIREVRLKEMLKPGETLQKAVSHYHWGTYIGFDAKGRYEVEMANGRRIAFDVATGQSTPTR